MTETKIPTTKYVVYLTNPDDQQHAGPHSFSSGRYGFAVCAADIEGAITAVVERSKQDGFFGTDWMAKITPIIAGRGASHPLSWMHDAGVRLRSDVERLW